MIKEAVLKDTRIGVGLRLKRNLLYHILSFILPYIILASYFNLVPMLLPMNDFFRFVHMLSFFLVAYVVAKQLYNRGLDMYGIIFFRGWRKNLVLGFILGFIAWIVLFTLYFLFKKYEFNGVNINNNTIIVLVSVIFGYGFGSLISDMIVRGLVFNHFRDKLHPKYVFTIALILYALDDVWYEGFSFQNTIFSLALGLGLTYAYYRTKSIWASAGMHFGLNVIYGLFFGVTGKIGDGIFIFTINKNPTIPTTWLSTFTSLLLFILVCLVIRNFTIFKGIKFGK